MENISKLPKWAQEAFKELQRERDVAVKALRQYTDSQTESPFYIQSYESTGDTEGTGPASYTRYIQTHRISVQHQSVHLDVVLHDDGISLQWGQDAYSLLDVAFIPHSYQKAKIIHRDKMRS